MHYVESYILKTFRFIVALADIVASNGDGRSQLASEVQVEREPSPIEPLILRDEIDRAAVQQRTESTKLGAYNTI